MKLMYIYKNNTSWTRGDFEIFAEKFKITRCYIASWLDVLKYFNPFYIYRHDTLVLWFASLYFFPVVFVGWLLRKKIIIIAGGFDVAKLPEIRYGAFLEPWYKRIFRKFMFKVADKVISVSKSNQKEAIRNAGVNPLKSVMIYHGFKPRKVELKPFNQRKKQIVTIGAVNNETYLRKGHKYFLDLAKIMPDWNFTLVGRISKDFRQLEEFKKCPNLNLTDYADDNKLERILNESQIYLQLSHHEGFGCSIVDAALMGCYPVVYNRFAMGEVVEGFGSVVESFEEIKKEIIGISDIEVDEIRQFYAKKFPFEKRANSLAKVSSSL